MAMELRHLRYFVAIAEEGHITRAARRLGLQQPPLTQQLRRLEDELGTPLFRRHPRGVELTPAGEAFLPEARAALDAAARAARRARLAAEGRDGLLQVGFVTSAALHGAVPRLIRLFRERHPGIVLSVTEGNAAEVTDGVAAGRLHAGLIRALVGLPPGLAAVELLREAVLLALPAGHRLLSAWQPGLAAPALRLSQLAGERFILVRRGSAPGLYADLCAACRRAGFEPDVVAQVDRMLTNVNLVAAGVGVSAVPASMQGMQQGQVAYCPVLDAPELVAPLTLLHREDAGPATRRFVALAIAEAAAQPAADPTPR